MYLPTLLGSLSTLQSYLPTFQLIQPLRLPTHLSIYLPNYRQTDNLSVYLTTHLPTISYHSNVPTYLPIYLPHPYLTSYSQMDKYLSKRIYPTL